MQCGENYLRLGQSQITDLTVRTWIPSVSGMNLETLHRFCLPYWTQSQCPYFFLGGFCAESFSETHCVWTSDPWEQWNNSYLSLQVSKFTAICYTAKENVHILMRMLLSFNTLRMRKDIKYPIYITCVCFRALIFNRKACTLLSSPVSAHFSKKRISTSEEDEDK